MAVKPLESQREAAITQLRHHYVQNTFDADEYERRVELVTQAADLDALQAVTADLQPLAPPVTAQAAVSRPGALVLADQPSLPKLAIFGSLERRGGWLTSRKERVITVFGSAELSLVGATLPPGVTTIDLVCVFGSIELTVPTDVTVELDVLAVLANAEDHGGRAPRPEGAPVLRIRGVSVFGNVEVTRG